MRDKKPAVGNLISCMVTMLVLLAIVAFSADYFARLNTAIAKKRIERSYMLSMESEGYLSDKRKNELTNDLNALGVTDISYDGTTFIPAGYGNTVTLSVQGRLVTDGIHSITGAFRFVRGGNYEFRIYQTSTAKY